MLAEFISLVSWSNGIVMIGVFALVVLILIATLFLLLNSGKARK